MRIKIVNKSKHNLPSYSTDASAGMDLRAYRKGITMKKGLDYLILALFLSSFFASCGKKITPSISGLGRGKGYDSSAFEYVYVEAIKEKLLGNRGDALRYLEQCAKINPQSDAVYYQMALILIAGGDNINGKKFAKKALALDPDNIWYIMMLAGTYYQERKLDSAIICYEQAVRRYPEKENLILTLGTLYSENKKFEKAEELFDNLDKKYGINEASTVANVKNLMSAKKYNEAVDLLAKLLKEYPDEIMYNGLLAEIYREQGESGKAMEVYNLLMERNPDNPSTQLSLCDFLINEKKYDELLLLINSVILNESVLREDKISLFAKMIETDELVKQSGDQLNLAIMVLEAAYQNDDIIQLLRPEMLIKQEKFDDAAKRLEEIIAKNQSNYFAWEKLLLVYLQEEDFKKLELRGEECALRFNRSFLAKMLYAAAATENKKYDLALEEVRKAEILAGENEEMILQVLSTRADIYYRMKNYNKAFEIFETAINNNNEDLTILNNYAYYLAEQNLKLKEAEKMARQVIEKEKENNTFLDTYAWVLFKRGKLKEAEKIMESIINSGEKPDAEWYEHMGFIKKKRKNCKEAINNWNTALELDETKSELLEEIKKCQGK